jgi:hypothetical protein
MSKKIIVYQKGSTKPIVLTDDTDADNNTLKEKIIELFNQDKIYTLETTNDMLIGRPSDLQSILISSGLDKKDTKYSGDISLHD